MKPYIKSIDISTPLGELVYGYGEQRLALGFIYGFLTGAIVVCAFRAFTEKKIITPTPKKIV